MFLSVPATEDTRRETTGEDSVRIITEIREIPEIPENLLRGVTL
jgi:hypothetical protein